MFNCSPLPKSLSKRRHRSPGLHPLRMDRKFAGCPVLKVVRTGGRFLLSSGLHSRAMKFSILPLRPLRNTTAILQSWQPDFLYRSSLKTAHHNDVYQLHLSYMSCTFVTFDFYHFELTIISVKFQKRKSGTSPAWLMMYALSYVTVVYMPELEQVHVWKRSSNFVL